jgi:hypothetical protein
VNKKTRTGNQDDGQVDWEPARGGELVSRAPVATGEMPGERGEIEREMKGGALGKGGDEEEQSEGFASERVTAAAGLGPWVRGK